MKKHMAASLLIWRDLEQDIWSKIWIMVESNLGKDSFVPLAHHDNLTVLWGSK